jgi:glycogen synthase
MNALAFKIGFTVRILHVFDHSIPLHSGYTFRSRALLGAMQDRGWETMHLTSPKHTMDGPNPETVDGMLFHRTAAPQGRLAMLPGLGELLQINATKRELEKLVIHYKPDILHAHSPVLNAVATQRVAEKYNIPWVYEIRAFWEDAAVSNGGSVEGDLRYRLTRWLETRAVFAANAVGGICQGILGDLKARGVSADKLFTTPNAVDSARFGQKPVDTALALKLGLVGKDVIGFIGSFYDYEGLDILLSAVPELKSLRPDLRVVLVGGGPQENALKAQVKKLGLEAIVQFTGRVPNAEVERYYSLMDILVFPRKKQRLTDLVTPLKPLEAMAEYKLVAASDIGGHRELIEDGVTGTLFAPDSASALAKSVADLFENRALWPQRRENARTFVEVERSWARTVENYAPVYARLTGKSG